MLKITTTVFALLISSLSFAQLTLEHTYEIGGNIHDTNEGYFKTEDKAFHYTYDTATDYVLKIYNEDHTLYKTITLPIDPSYELIWIDMFTDKLFNSNDLIEFIVRIKLNSTENKLLLFNENAELLMDFGNREDAKIIKGLNNNYKLFVYHDAFYEYNREYTIKDVYNIEAGTLSNEQLDLITRKTALSYPNPASANINIANSLGSQIFGTLKIYNTTGAIVIEKEVKNTDGEYLKIDISNLANGTYISKLNGVSKRFIKK
ncbi:T9SS type A sorting domain-containing protein [Formosa haliotis]|uniref:T9SS type A sorting domain-containing protein n=1 Tax=Formosa haliotis TaxID=1555194 RepID=UPI000825663C|nr:T9SS type A sorting domain-containing protein [Formosa haliotis]